MNTVIEQTDGKREAGPATVEYNRKQRHLNITSFIHPVSTYLPCTGIGRHVNAMLIGLSQRQDVDLSLLFAREHLTEHRRLPDRCPLAGLPFEVFGYRENVAERLWKLTGFPHMDAAVQSGTDWVYCPMHTRIPIRRRPVAITIHDVQAFETNLPWSHTRGHRGFRRKWSLWVRKAIDESRVVFTVSQFTKRRMIELLGAEPEKIVVVGNGVDQRFLEASRNCDNSPAPKCETPYLLVVGGLTGKKGADWILDLARILQRQRLDVRFVVTGPVESRFKNQADELGSFEFPGFVSDDELPRLYHQSLAMLFLSPYEGFGIPVIEAMASETPAIVANRASLPEVAGDSGIIVDPQQPEEIAACIKSLLNEPRFRTDVVTKGLGRAQNFTWQRCVNIVHRTLAERA